MINRIMKTGVAAVALAASALLASPANAQGARADRSFAGQELRGGQDFNRNDARNDRNHARNNRNNARNNRNQNNFVNRGNSFGRNNVRRPRVQLNAYGQTAREVKFLADKAIYACSCQLEVDAHRYGFQDGGFNGTPYYEQVGPNRFVVKGTATLFDGYDYSRQSYDCVTKGGGVKKASNLHPVVYNDRGRNRRTGIGRVSFTFGNAW